MDDILIRRAKFSTVAIGIRNYTKKDHLEIHGTGFYYDTRGYLLSAGHVLRKVRKIQHANELAKINSEIVAIGNHVRNNRIEVLSDKIEEIIFPNMPTSVTDPTAPIIPDLGIAKVKPDRSKYPFLKIKQLEDLIDPHLYTGDKIVLCGYPAAEQSLSFIVDTYKGLRFSPVMQFGHVAALLPFDDSLPYGIQTDIIGTGGSSGSPIILHKTGEVIAIAQKIILTLAVVDVPEKAQRRVRLPDKLVGFAHIGLTYGDSYHMFYDVPNMTKNNFADGINGLTNPVHSKAFVRSEFHTYDHVTLTEDDL